MKNFISFFLFKITNFNMTKKKKKEINPQIASCVLISRCQRNKDKKTKHTRKGLATSKEMEKDKTYKMVSYYKHADIDTVKFYLFIYFLATILKIFGKLNKRCSTDASLN